MSERELRPLRSVLYMPGSNARALEKAKTIPADALILDLEDAVAPDAKAEARQQVCDAAASGFAGAAADLARRSALATTETELRLMASAATIGLSRIPNAG